MRTISSSELREKYQQFFEEKEHVRIPSAPLVPENDPSVLFTTAGMHPLVPYLKGQPHPQGDKLTDVQKCLRTTDIDEVGDATHATVFEMLGNWSLGSYFKKKAIEWSWEFLTGKKWLGIDPNYLAVSVFAGDDDTPPDEESAKIWKKVGIPDDRLVYLGIEENWWPAYAKALAGQGPAGLQGPDTEMFYWAPLRQGYGGQVGSQKPPKKFDPKDPRWVEIWNDVFMEYNRTEEGKLEQLAQRNVDTGMGLERTVMVLNGLQSIYEIDTYKKLKRLIHDRAQNNNERPERIMADHIKAITFILGDENPVAPSNVERGYVLRRLIRRTVWAARDLGIIDVEEVMEAGVEMIVDEYKSTYPSLGRDVDGLKSELKKEVERFRGIIERRSAIFNRLGDIKILTGVQGSSIASTYGLPVGLIKEEAQDRGVPLSENFDEEFNKDQERHKQVSRGESEKKFAGGLVDQSNESVKYHTATHLLQQALREVLGDHVLQRGSNITADRLRFDFSHPDKMTPEEIARVEKLVNEKIEADLPVTREEMTVEEAKKKGALGLFEDKYADRVSVYMINGYSAEICGGPHVERTGELGTFKIKKEESSSAGIRRIKAVLE